MYLRVCHRCKSSVNWYIDKNIRIDKRFATSMQHVSLVSQLSKLWTYRLESRIAELCSFNHSYRLLHHHDHLRIFHKIWKERTDRDQISKVVTVILWPHFGHRTKIRGAKKRKLVDTYRPVSFQLSNVFYKPNIRAYLGQCGAVAVTAFGARK